MTSERTIVFRCDGTAATGLGHTSRSLALAEAFVDLGYQCVFLGHFDDGVRSRLRAAGMHWDLLAAPSWTAEDAAALIATARRTSAVGIVIDTYLADAHFVERVEQQGGPVLLIDDFAGLPSYPCSAVLNFTSRAPEFSYPCESVRCFLGPRWFLGRRSLRQLRAAGARPTDDVRRVLVSSGGNDPFDVVLPLVNALHMCERNLSVHVVARATYEALPQLDTMLARFHGETNILTQLPDLSRELAWADLCLSNAGLTKYEAAYVGTPAGVLSQNEGQRLDAERFETLGITMNLGMAECIDVDQLTARVSRLLTEQPLRQQLQDQSLSIFPADPTLDLARVLLSDVFQVT
jgi:spore coat polysaccharide biosynthesis predicted glycosyltransferase SpsG